MDAEAAAALGDVDHPGDEVGDLLTSVANSSTTITSDGGASGVRARASRRGPWPRPRAAACGGCSSARSDVSARSDRFGVEVGDVADGVRAASANTIARRPALVVDEQERQRGSAGTRGQRGDDRLQQLALAGAGRAADQRVRAVLDEVELERTGRADADRGRAARTAWARPTARRSTAASAAPVRTATAAARRVGSRWSRLAAVASRSGASDIATWSISRALAGSSSRCSAGSPGR